MTPAEQALAFCSVLFADEGDDGGLAAQRAVVFTLPQRASRWLPVSDPAAIADAAITADAKAEAVYLSMAASSAEIRTTERGNPLKMEAAEVTCVFGVWADLDYAAAGAHKATNLPPDEAAIRRVLDATGLPPTILWSSGHGLQAFWKFDAPFHIESDDDRAEVHTLLIAWQRTIAAHAHRLGNWRIDMVHNLDRVLRVPGTTNRKIAGSPVPARLLEINPERLYTLDQLNERCLDGEYLKALDTMVAPADSGASNVDLHALWRVVNSAEYRLLKYEPEWITAVIEAVGEEDSRRGKRFARIWRQSGTNTLDDHSSSDASVARFIADFGGDERAAMEVIMCMRLRSQQKVDKVAPDGRGPTYLVQTVAKVFEQHRRDEEKRAAQVQAAERVLAVQDAEMAPRAPEAPPVEPELLVPREESVGRAHDLGGAAVARTRAITGGTVPDSVPEEVEANGPRLEIPSANRKITDDSEPAASQLQADEDLAAEDEPDPDVAVDEPIADIPADDVVDDEHPPADEPPVDEPPADEIPAGQLPPPDEPPPSDPPPAADDDESDDERSTPLGPVRSEFPTRTEGTAMALRALSSELLTRYNGEVEIWCGEQRGSGPDRKRCLVLRARRDIGYADGTKVHPANTPLRSDWWPVGTFHKVAGWIGVLEQDFQLQVTPMQQDDFNTRHKPGLIRIWRDDSSGGDIKAVARQSLANYLMDHPPVRDWNEAMSMGQPWIMMRGAGWSVDAPFVVCIRWAEFARYVKVNHLGVQINPERMAEIAHHIGAVDARTPEQPGRWKRLDRGYFTDREWLRILVRAQQQAEARERRGSGLRLLPGGQADRPERDDEAPHGRGERREAR